MLKTEMSNDLQLWQRYQKYLFLEDALEMSLDISRMNFGENFFSSLEPRLQKAYEAMAQLEKGAIANPDENRMVGHYWLRAPQLAPADLRQEITDTLENLKNFAAQIHEGEITPQRGGKFENVLIVGIGGSALGPQFVAHALSQPREDKMTPYFFDNTDPDGIERVLAQIGEGLKTTLVVVISKSGGTKETRNGMLEAQAAYHEMGLHFGNHAVAITGEGSQLDKVAVNERWLASFPMWDWVGGRTSVTSAVGLLPALLQGFDVDAFLEGAAQMDEATRRRDTLQNPAALLAAMWFHATGGAGRKDMVILPYKDRLELFSRYLQQLIMESLGKEKDLQGRTVHQGIAVYGNKGSTDQHAYVQQLRDGINNFFATFIEVLKTRDGEPLQVESGVTSGDYLFGFLHGTRRALYENGRESLTITVRQVDAQTVGRLIALYERAVGFYASLIEINAYHQPGVEAGKVAAQDIISLQARVLELLHGQPGSELRADEIAAQLHVSGEVETIFHILRHLEVSGRVRRHTSDNPQATYVVH